MLVVRDVMPSPEISASRLVISSVMPSAKYSSSGSPRFSNGSTAMVGRASAGDVFVRTIIIPIATMAASATVLTAAGITGIRRFEDATIVAAEVVAPGASRAARNSAAVAYLAAGTRARARASAESISAGTVSRVSRIVGMGSVNRLAMIACAVGPACGASPANIS